MNRVLFIAALLLSAIAASAQTPAGDAKNGKELFNKYTCYGCHGFSGQNGPGARLVPMNMPVAGFIAYVRNPPRPNQMPSYSPKVLTDEQLTDIWTYAKSLPDNPKAKDIPLLQEISKEK